MRDANYRSWGAVGIAHPYQVAERAVAAFRMHLPEMSAADHARHLGLPARTWSELKDAIAQRYEAAMKAGLV